MLNFFFSVYLSFTSHAVRYRPAAKKTLLELFNESWKNGTVPALWKRPPSSQSIKRQRQERPKQLPPHQSPKLPWKTSRESNQQKIDIFLGRTENTVTNTDGISKTQKHRRSAGPHCPRDRECLPRKENGCLWLFVCLFLLVLLCFLFFVGFFLWFVCFCFLGLFFNLTNAFDKV